MNDFILIIVIALIASPAFSHEPKLSDRIDIIHILESYSERTDVKFVTDPRVKARVNMVGLTVEELTQTNLMDILIIHNFTAYEKDGVVYVLPRAAADYLGSDIGEILG